MSSSMKRNIQEIYGGGGSNGNSASNGNSTVVTSVSSNGNHHHVGGVGGGGLGVAGAGVGGVGPGGAGHHLGQLHHPDPNASQESKKSRLEQQQQTKQEASRVVHLRNIPHQLTEQEIVYLGLHFGNVVNVLFLRAKNQAFLEFEQIGDAQQMIAHFAVTSTTFSGKKIFVQYSNHQELNTDPSNASNLAAQNALNEAVQLHRAGRDGGKATVLRATILNMMYPVTLDVLTQIFSKFGPIVKMITFNKNDKFQALVQMRDAIAAQNAKMALNGQNIYTGCCTLQIDYSKLTNLEVRFNNDKSRDFTNPMLPNGDTHNTSDAGSAIGGGGGGGAMNNGSIGGNSNVSNMQSMYQQQQQQQQQQSLIGHPPGMFGGSGGGNVGGSSGNGVGSGGGGLHQMNAFSSSSGMSGQNSSGMSHHQMMNNMYQSQQQMQAQSGGGSGSGYMGMGMGGMGGGIMGGQQTNVMMGGQSQNHHQSQTAIAQPGQTSVLLVSNLNEDCVNTDALFTLFGVYGDVTRVKILFNKKDSALINFANPQQAATALANLDRAKLWNKMVRVFGSKHTTVQMPKEGQPDSGLTKDYSNSPLHRFKKPGSKNFNNIFPPSPTLHLSNIPPNVTEQQLRDLFQQYGQIKAFKFFQKDRKMALIQMGSAEEATHALIGAHNYQLADNMHLRCTFSKATV